MYNESEVVYVKKEIKTEFLDENEIKSEVIEEEETPTDDDFVPETDDQDVNEGCKQTQQLTSPICSRSKVNVSDQSQLSLHPEESASASLNGKRRSTSITNSAGGTNKEDILIKKEVKSENRDEFEFKLEFVEETVLDDLVPCEPESIVQQIDQQTFSSPCNRSNTDFSPQQVSHLAWILPKDKRGNSETRPTDDGNSKSGQPLCEESLMDRTSDHFSFIQNAVNREEEKLEISSAILTSSSVASKSKKIKVNKPAVKKLFKSTRDKTKSAATDKSLKTKRFLCEKCESSFWTKSHLILHTKTVHNRITRYECYFCCKRFVERSYLFIHIRRHTKEQPFICCICGSKFGHSNSLSVHIKTVHEGIQPLKSLKCSFKECDKWFSTKSILNDHMRIHTGERPFNCDICESKFKQRRHLNQHIKAVHQKIKPFECSFKECGKWFSMKSVLNDHMRIHTGERPFNCDICESKFKQRNHLNQHIKAVHQRIRIKPFKCTYDGCAYQFSKRSALNDHIRIHNGETPYQCLICKKQFSFKFTLTKHENKKIKCQPAVQNTLNCDENLEISPTFACTSASVPSKSNKLGSRNNKTAIHKLPKPFKCSYKECNKQYTKEFYLTDHMRIHTLSEAISNMIYL